MADMGIGEAVLLSALISGGAGVAASALAKKPSAPAAPPVVAPAPLMPTPTDASVQAAQQRSIAEQLARRGRASTVMTGDTGQQQKLGA